MNYRLVAETVEPLDALLAAKPGQLPLRVMANIQLRLLNSVQKITTPAQIFDDAAIAVRSERVGFRRDASRQQTPNFITQPGSKMLFGAFIDSAIKLFARRIQGKDPDARRTFGRLGALWRLR